MNNICILTSRTPWDVLGGNAQSIYLGRRHVVRQPEMDHATCYLNVLRPDPGPVLPLELGEQSFANMPIVCFVRLPVKLRRDRESTYEIGAADDAHNLAIANDWHTLGSGRSRSWFCSMFPAR